MTTAAGSRHNFRQDVDCRDVEERSGAEEHGESRGIEGRESFFALLRQAKVGGQSGQRGGQREDEEIATDAGSIQSIAKEESDEAERGRRFVQHDGQKDDHLGGRMGRCGRGSKSYTVRSGVNHQT